MRNVKYIKGTLTPYNPSAITRETAGNIRRAVDKAGFFEAIRATAKWGKGIITLNFVNKVCGGEESIMDFIETLNRFITLRGVEELCLEGTITLIMDGEPFPVMVRVNVKEGMVTYQHTGYVWTDEIIVHQ